MEFNIYTLHPEIYPGSLDHSVIGRALRQRIFKLNIYNIRNYATDKHKTVDDTPYGGGSGMVMRPDVIANALDETLDENSKKWPILYLTPSGELFRQSLAHQIIQNPGINIVCGSFEGVDERVIKYYNMQEISVGEYVLSSGDIAALVVVNCCSRLLPGVLGNPSSLQEESFAINSRYEDLVEYPKYTKPKEWREMKVPEVLTSGNHPAIDLWRFTEATNRTMSRRKKKLVGEKQ